MSNIYETVINYSGQADSEKLIPLVGTSYSEVDELQGIVNLLKKWQFKTALKELDKLIKQECQLIDSLLLKGEILSLSDHNLEAISVFERILEIDPDNIFALIMRLIQLIIIKGDEAEISSALNSFSKREPALSGYFTQVLDFIETNKLRFDFDSKNKPVDLICVCGYFLNDDGTMPSKLERRLDKVRALAETYPESTILLSGGAVQNQYCEAVEMKKYLREAGVNEDRLVSLERARDTVGNIIEFMDYIKPRQFSNICIVTSKDHLPRAWMSLKMGLDTYQYDAVLFGSAPEETIGDMKKEIRLSYQTVFRIAGLFVKKDIEKQLRM